MKGKEEGNKRRENEGRKEERRKKKKKEGEFEPWSGVMRMTSPDSARLKAD